MTFVNSLKLITFDITNTILKFNVTAGKQYGDIGKLYGVLCDNDALTRNFQKYWEEMNQKYPIYGLKSGMKWEDWWKELVRNTFSESQCKLEQKKSDAIFYHLLQLYTNPFVWQICPGALEILSYIKNEGIALGVISNFDPRLEPILKCTKLRPYFQFVLTSYDCGVEKPDPAIFKKAMEISNIADLKPEHCMHIGDEPILDYQGAINSGWYGILVHDDDITVLKDQYPEAEIDTKFVYKSLVELLSHLKNDSICFKDK